MTLWQRSASAVWLARNEARLEELAGSDLAIIARPGKNRSLIEVTCRNQPLAARLINEFGGSAKRIPHNWWTSFSSEHPPIRIGRRLQIVSAFPPRALPDQTLAIPAAGAFGTGEHSTTALSLRLLEETTRKLPGSWRLLDAGTGTGILALAARRLGASAVIGLDNDPSAVMNARHNARLNYITRARFVCTDVLRFKPDQRFEVMTANLFSELLVAALPVFRRALKPKGALILSGILREQIGPLLTALGRAGFQLEKLRHRGKWIALQVRRKKTRSGGLTTAVALEKRPKKNQTGFTRLTG